MKLYYISFFTFFIFTGCHENTITPPSTATNSNEEKIILDAIKTYPDSLALQEQLIQYYRENESFDRAIATTNAVLSKDSTIARFWDIKGTLLAENKDTLGAIKCFEKAVDIYPEPMYIISLGTLYAQTKNPLALAISDALLLGKKAAADKEAYFIKGIYFAKINDQQNAIKAYENCISLDYTFMDAYLEKSIVLYDLGKYDEALKTLSKATSIQNSYDIGYYWAGRCFEKLNRTNDAIEQYKTALIYDPEYTEAKDALAKMGVK